WVVGAGVEAGGAGGGSAVAVLVTVPEVAVTFAVIVKVTLPVLGKVGMIIPVLCIKATVVLPTVGQAAPFIAEPQVTPVALRPLRSEARRVGMEGGPGPLSVTSNR